MSLRLHPTSLATANEFVTQFHRHHQRSQGHKFSVSVVDAENKMRGVAIASLPRSRKLMEQQYLEIVRVCTDGAPNACSMLYGAMRRAAIALGYQPERVVTYTLPSEGGASLRAAGWVCDGPAGGGSWDRSGRHREDKAPTEIKLRWRAA